jgi:hypothetical protein
MTDVNPATTLGCTAHPITPASRLYLGRQSVNPQSVISYNERLLQECNVRVYHTKISPFQSISQAWMSSQQN